MSPRFLMCPPEHYGVEYEINPWMDRAVQPDRGLARRQWDNLVRILEKDLGCAVETITPRPGLPDMVFTANAGYVQGDCFIPARFRYRQRRGEEVHFRKWFSSAGFDVKDLPGEWSFEGFGDALPVGEFVVAGYRFRSDIQAHGALGRILERKVVSLELVDSRFYHLDTCFCPLGDRGVLYVPSAFDEYGTRALAAACEGLALYPSGEDDALAFACNAVVVGSTVVLNTGADDVCEYLRRSGYRVIETPLSEFLKSGGGAKCLTCRLD